MHHDWNSKHLFIFISQRGQNSLFNNNVCIFFNININLFLNINIKLLTFSATNTYCETICIFNVGFIEDNLLLPIFEVNAFAWFRYTMTYDILSINIQVINILLFHYKVINILINLNLNEIQIKVRTEYEFYNNSVDMIYTQHPIVFWMWMFFFNQLNLNCSILVLTLSLFIFIKRFFCGK